MAFIEDFVAQRWRRLNALAARFLLDVKGVSTVEYALLVVGIIGIVTIGIGFLSGAFSGMFATLSDRLTAAVT